jgi:heme-degrading monooxygenase HmoA
MYSRVTQLEIDTMRIGMADAAALFAEEVLPGLRDQDGYEGALALATPEGKGMIVTFWETEEGAQDAAGFASGELSRLMTIFRAPPGREVYEVAVADLPEGVSV